MVNKAEKNFSKLGKTSPIVFIFDFEKNTRGANNDKEAMQHNPSSCQFIEDISKE